ncbi:hypothetical protein WMY93_007150 [Mugilogobius chulae]|uniref:VWFA domain-containing protein n=1 Tax=Mugilogobius chulae TaxID=88201 RepID=A0AAW0PM28_9GOBI
MHLHHFIFLLYMCTTAATVQEDFGMSTEKDLTQPQIIQRPVSEPAFQDCTKKTVDLVFLFDGSSSQKQFEFEENKVFIEDIMAGLKNTSIKFAAVQFSTQVRTIFTFNDFINGTAISKLQKEEQLKGLTNTHMALDFVLKEHLNNTSNGATEEATKVLVLITDGDPSDTDRQYGVFEKYDSMNIIRFVIGVREVDVTRLRVIASEPKDENTFHIENYNGLTEVWENLQRKILQTEGTKAALNLIEEMSRTGFRAAYRKEQIVQQQKGQVSQSVPSPPSQEKKKKNNEKKRNLEENHTEGDIHSIRLIGNRCGPFADRV